MLTSNMKEVERRLQVEFDINIPNLTKEKVENLTTSLVEGIGRIPWRLSGAWQASTNVSVGSPDESLPSAPFGPPPGRADVLASLADYKLGDIVFITLPQPYSRKLEVFGTSKKAPAFSVLRLVENTVQQLKSESQL